MDDWLRYALFWGLDWARGSPLARHIQSIRDIRRSPAAESAHRQERLRVIMAHACRSTTFYRSYRQAKDLGELPIVGQVYFRSHYQDFTSDDQELHSSAVKVTTSGSYGMPLIYHMDRDKYLRRTAEVIVHNGLAGYRVGTRLARLHGSTHVHEQHSRWSRLKQNLVDIYVPNADAASLEVAAKRLAVGDIRVVVSWPSLLLAVARQAGNLGIRFPPPRGIISYGEVLAPMVRDELEAAYGCRVFDRYATMETGILAHEESGQEPGLWCNTAGYVIELLDLTRDAPAEPGQLARIVVTDLYARAVPIIRYDTGDIALRWGSKGGRVWLGSIDGRYNELISAADGAPVPAFWVYSCIHRNEKRNINNQFQVAQTGPSSYEVRVVPRGNVSPAAVEASMKTVVGEQSQVRVVFVEAIEKLPSGKQAVVLNLWRTAPRSKDHTEVLPKEAGATPREEPER